MKLKMIIIMKGVNTHTKVLTMSDNSASYYRGKVRQESW